ncbi:hypothetical protein ACWDRR_22585 [Kitasatospora sp. NPDC003701]
MAEDVDYAEQSLQDFIADRHGQFLPTRRFDKSESWETYRLLGIEVAGFAGDYVSVTWPDGWHKVRAGRSEWEFELRAADGTAMVAGTVLIRRGRDSAVDMQLTGAGRRAVRRRYQAMPAWQQHLLKAKGGPWKPRYPSMRKARQFSDFQRERLSVTVSRLRALGWQIGEELPAGVEILLTDQAAGWTEEHHAGDRFWVMPSDGGPSLAYGVAAGEEYPWCQWDAKTSWASASGAPAGPTAIATEIDQVLRSGVPAGVTTWPVLGHAPAVRSARRPAPPSAVAAIEEEVPVRDSVTLWDQPLVDPRRVSWAHRRALESCPDLPSPSGKLRRWRAGSLFTPASKRGALWGIAHRFEGLYFLPRSLPEQFQEILRRARAAARAIEDAPGDIRDELLWRDQQLSTSRLLLGERLLLLARTLETADEDPAFDAESDCHVLIGILEARASESFDMALRQAEVVEVMSAENLYLDGRFYVPSPRSKHGVSLLPTVEHVVCDCGQSRWLLILIDGRGAIGCVCGRLRWEDRLTRNRIEHAAPGAMTPFRPPFDLDAVAAEVGFGPFRHKW